MGLSATSLQGGAAPWAEISVPLYLAYTTLFGECSSVDPSCVSVGTILLLVESLTRLKHGLTQN